MMNSGQYKPNDFTPVVSAMNLADHVIHITDNTKKFNDCERKEEKKADGSVTVILTVRQSSLTNIVRDQATQIFLNVFTANKIDLRKEPWRKSERIGKQEEAIKLCGEHLAMIQLCRKHFHLSAKKIKYWGKMTIDTRNSIEAWNKSDRDRYKDI